jgi:alpha-N-arabinofuranosidase
MVDPHWYRDPNFFFANNHLFDEAPRTHDIYVGEYACLGGVGAGNLLAAISEAAFILGMERNSDVVKMSSYAPLFENENRRDWPCNLIHINSLEVYGRASYYVQQMAAENRPTYNIYVSETTTGDDNKNTRHFCQAGYDEQTGELIIKVVNGTDQPYRRSFTIDGARNVLPTGKVITLNGDAKDENTFEQPTKLAPRTTLFGKFGRQFDYEFPAMSFTVMRVKVSK